MRIGKIAHSRCGEPDGNTYVVIPDEMTEDEYRAAVRQAVGSYQNALDFVDPDEPLRPYTYSTSINEMRKMDPELTVGEIVAKADLVKEAHDAWTRKRVENERSFGEHLKENGLSVVQWYDESIETHANWGHRHGKKIRLDGIPYRDPYYEED